MTTPAPKKRRETRTPTERMIEDIREWQNHVRTAKNIKEEGILLINVPTGDKGRTEEALTNQMLDATTKAMAKLRKVKPELQIPVLLWEIHNSLAEALTIHEPYKPSEELRINERDLL
jgi:hypothetical protein